jgi:hypothetical protein
MFQHVYLNGSTVPKHPSVWQNHYPIVIDSAFLARKESVVLEKLYCERRELDREIFKEEVRLFAIDFRKRRLLAFVRNVFPRAEEVVFGENYDIHARASVEGFQSFTR